MGSAIKRVGFVQNLMLGAEAFRLMFEAGEKVFNIALDIGKELVGAAGHAERMGIAFKTLAGDEGGQQALEYIEKIKKSSELSGAQLEDMGAQLMTAGFKAKELGQALPAALDIAGFKGGGLENIQAAVNAMAKIRESGKVGDKTLMNLGLGENAQQNLLGGLAKAKGESIAQIKKAMEAGKLDPQEVLYQVYQQVIARQHGALGTTAEKMTNTVTGKLEKIKQLPEEIFEKWSQSPGFAKFSDSLSKVLEKLDPDGPNGQKIFAGIDKISTKVVEMIDKFVTGDSIDRFVDGFVKASNSIDKIPAALDTIKTVTEAIIALWTGAKFLGALNSFQTASGGGGAVGSAVSGVTSKFGKVAAVGQALGTGYAVGTALDDMFGLSDRISGTGEHSRIKEEEDRKDAALRAPSAGDHPGVGRVNQTANIHPGAVVINAPGGKADEIADHVNKTLPGAMQQGFERMAVSSGAM